MTFFIPFASVSFTLSPSLYYTAQKMKFSIKGFFSKYEEIHRKLWIWSHFLMKALVENFIFCTVLLTKNNKLWNEKK